MHHRGKTRDQMIHTALAIVAAAALIVGCTAVIVLLTSGGSSPRAARPAGGVDATSLAPAPVTTSASTPAPADPAGPSGLAGSSGQPGAATSAPVAPLTYTVKPGDNLTVIAAWFHLHGYGGLYDANKSVIGDNPSLIHPGQVITVSSAGLTVS